MTLSPVLNTFKDKRLCRFTRCLATTHLKASLIAIYTTMLVFHYYYDCSNKEYCTLKHVNKHITYLHGNMRMVSLFRKASKQTAHVGSSVLYIIHTYEANDIESVGSWLIDRVLQHPVCVCVSRSIAKKNM